MIGGLEHFLFSPIVGMMIQSDFHISQAGDSTTNQICIEKSCLKSHLQFKTNMFWEIMFQPSFPQLLI